MKSPAGIRDPGIILPPVRIALNATEVESGVQSDVSQGVLVMNADDVSAESDAGAPLTECLSVFGRIQHAPLNRHICTP